MLTLGLALLLGVIKLCNKSDQLAFFVAAGCLAIVSGRQFHEFYRRQRECRIRTTKTASATFRRKLHLTKMSPCPDLYPNPSGWWLKMWTYRLVFYGINLKFCGEYFRSYNIFDKTHFRRNVVHRQRPSNK